MSNPLELPKTSKHHTKAFFPPMDAPPAKSHHECPICKFYVKREWMREADGFAHFVHVCLKCGRELT